MKVALASAKLAANASYDPLQPGSSIQTDCPTISTIGRQHHNHARVVAAWQPSLLVMGVSHMYACIVEKISSVLEKIKE